jgi:phospholipid/cholesterol/gamma-HCH transport system substrate-binding protein
LASSASNLSRSIGSLFETIISALVILIALFFLAYVYLRTSTGHLGSYDLMVRMPNAAGLDVGNDVLVGGVKVGSVISLSLDPVDYSALIDVRVRDDLSLSVDSTPSVASSVMGDVALAITPGHANHMVEPGGSLGRPSRIAKTATKP